MPTVAEILRASGMSEESIAALDAKALTGFQGVLTASEQAAESARQLKEQAELAQRAQQDQYANTIAPALDQWGNEKAQLEAQNAFYKAQAEAAKANGFIAKDAPGYVPPKEPVRSGDGRFVPGGTVPGSPTYMTQQEGLRAVNTATWLIAEHMRLYGTPPPDDIETLNSEAINQHQDFRTYAAKKYNFEGKKAEIVKAAQDKERQNIVTETEARVRKEMAEQFGNNPNVRSAGLSQFTDLRKGVDSKQLKDPLTMTKQERHQATQSLIQKEIVEHANA